MGQQLAKLIIFIHLDVNGTIMLFDSTSTADIAKAIKEYISKLVRGTVIDNVWVANEDPFIENGIIYADHIKSLYPEEEKYKPYLENFTDSNEGKQFQDIFDAMFRVYSLMKQKNQVVFSSYYELEKELEKEFLFVTIRFIFRTFGNDGETLEKILGEKFIWFDSIIGKNDERLMKRKEDDKILTIQQFNNFVCHTPNQKFLVQENYKFWNETVIENGIKVKRSPLRGKYMEEYVQENDDCKNPICKTCVEKYNVVQIFFDDNNCINAKGKNVHVHRVNPYLALCDSKYFLNITKKILNSYSQYYVAYPEYYITRNTKRQCIETATNKSNETN